MVALGRFGCAWLLGGLSKGSGWRTYKGRYQVREENVAWVGKLLVR